MIDEKHSFSPQTYQNLHKLSWTSNNRTLTMFTPIISDLKEDNCIDILYLTVLNSVPFRLCGSMGFQYCRKWRHLALLEVFPGYSMYRMLCSGVMMFMGFYVISPSNS